VSSAFQYKSMFNWELRRYLPVLHLYAKRASSSIASKIKDEKSTYAKVGRDSCTIAVVLMMGLACPYLSALHRF